MTLHPYMHVKTNGDGVVSRRTFLCRVGAASAAGGVAYLGLKDLLAQNVQQLQQQHKHMILLFMNGGPSQFETFDPKPGTTNGGATTAIPTQTNGIQIAAPWTNVAAKMNDIAVIRSLSNREGAHNRAVYQMHTGYVPAGGVRFPHFGSNVAHEIAPQNVDLPPFVSVGGGFGLVGNGFLSNQYAPFSVNNPNQMPNNTQLPGSNAQFTSRMNLMQQLEQDFAAQGGQTLVQQHQNLYQSAASLVRSPNLRAFDLSQENAATRDRYGRNNFGQGCLLARRLIEAGVTFVEVTSGGWDTHQDNFTRTTTLSRSVDPGFGALIGDLRDRGLLASTLVVWMGEFGRTPRINGNTGRDHYPAAFSAALAGCGIRGGRVVGSTNSAGTSIASRPVSVADLFCTFCQCLNINPRKENVTPQGRPIKIVDGGSPIQELF